MRIDQLPVASSVTNNDTLPVNVSGKSQQLSIGFLTNAIRDNVYGAPLTASTSSAMTDQTRVYVYTGTTGGGYTNGHWYYYNGSAWTDGGAYNSSAVQTDATLTLAGVPADAAATGIKIGDVNSVIESVFEKKELLAASHQASNNNSAMVNNNDGSYTVGTSDYGNTAFGYEMTLDPGDYYLFGVPNGISVVSTTGTSSTVYNNRIVENTSEEPKRFHLNTQQALWVGFRSPSKPSVPYTIYPSLYKLVPTMMINRGVLDTGTDLNTVTDTGIYFLSSELSYTNAPVTGGFLFVTKTGVTVQQIILSIASTYFGGVYSRYGSPSGVTADWHRLGRPLDHSIAFFGDSIMWGRDGNGSAETRVSMTIPVIVRNTLGVSVANYGVSGQGYLAPGTGSQIAYDNVASRTLSNYDTIVLCYGVNDGYRVLGEWDSTDETTIMGQFNKIINYIYAQVPTMRVIVFAPFNGTNVGTYPDYWYGPRDNPPYASRKELSDALKRACDYYWIPYVEPYDSPLNAKTITQLLPDGVYPSETGYKMLGEWFAAKIRSVLF